MELNLVQADEVFDFRTGAEGIGGFDFA